MKLIGDRCITFHLAKYTDDLHTVREHSQELFFDKRPIDADVDNANLRTIT